jgi:hypothetical protein
MKIAALTLLLGFVAAIAQDDPDEPSAQVDVPETPGTTPTRTPAATPAVPKVQLPKVQVLKIQVLKIQVLKGPAPKGGGISISSNEQRYHLHSCSRID